MSGTIRPAESRDATEIAGYVHSAYSKYIRRIGKEPAPMRQDHAAAIEAGQTYVLIEDGRLVGTIQMWEERDHLFVSSVAVRPDRQGEGFGGRLMSFAERRAAEARLPEIRLYTNEKMWENLEFYERLGYEETHRKPDEGYRRVFLRKRMDHEAKVGTEEETDMWRGDDGR